MIKTRVFDKYCVFALPSLRTQRDSGHAVKVNCVLLSKTQYKVHENSIITAGQDFEMNYY